VTSKLIGRGSFSEVYLIKEKIHSNNLFLFDEEYSHIVLKKINLAKLIEKYIGKQKAKKMIFKEMATIKTISHQITPWGKNYMDELEDKSEDEIIYYKDKLQKLIQSEVDLLYNIYHYNIIKMFDYSININEKQFEYILKFEYMNCGDLYKILKSNYEPFEKYRNEYNGFNNELSIHIMKNVVEGLKFLHSLNIIHRDIKLHNILLHLDYNNLNGQVPTLSNYKIKISDLGFCCMHPGDDNENLPEFLVKDLKEKWKKLCGTPYYMAPEIITNLNEEVKYTKKCDIWSLGMTLYEMYFNVLPLTNINNINDIVRFFKNDFAQNSINSKIENVKGINKNLRETLKKTICINDTLRCTIDEIYNLITSNINQENTDSFENLLNNIITSTDNGWRMNNILKESYIELNFKNIIEMESWVKI
jgi:serine/threonine protein kinase